MKKLILLLFIPLVSFSQTYEEEKIKAEEVFESLSDDYIKTAALEFLRQDDLAIANASKKYPNPSDWEAQWDYQSGLENQFRLAWYKKQKWWKKIKKSESIALKVRSKIIAYALEKGWYDGL